MNKAKEKAGINKIEQDLAKTNSKDLSLEVFLTYVQEKMKVFDILQEFYNQVCFI